jgi:hypothetical protein
VVKTAGANAHVHPLCTLSPDILSSTMWSQRPLDSSKFTFKNLCLDTNDVFCFVGGDSIKVDESLFQDLEELDLDADEVLDDDSS